MWIIPSNHPLYSAFAPEVAVSKEDLKELSEILPYRLMWKSKPSATTTWLQRWSRVYWLPVLFGRTLKPSHHLSFTERHTESLVDIHALRSAQQASSRGKKTRATCGRTSQSTSPQLSLFGVFSKMLRTTSTLDLKPYTLNYQQWGIMLKQEYTARKKLARLTRENGYSSSRWQTPVSSDATMSKKDLSKLKLTESGSYRYVNAAGMQSNAGLSNQVQMWGTPRVANNGWIGTNPENHKSRLEDQVMKWPTPTVSTGDYQNQSNGTKAMKLQGAVKMYPTPTVQDSNNLSGQSQQKKNTPPLNAFVLTGGPPNPESHSTSGRRRELLNPAWVAQLMGTTLEKTFFVCTETWLSNKQQK